MCKTEVDAGVTLPECSVEGTTQSVYKENFSDGVLLSKNVISSIFCCFSRMFMTSILCFPETQF